MYIDLVTWAACEFGAEFVAHRKEEVFKWYGIRQKRHGINDEMVARVKEYANAHIINKRKPSRQCM